jgi:hypothetical protein
MPSFRKRSHVQIVALGDPAKLLLWPSAQNGPRLAGKLREGKQDVRVFLMNDTADLARDVTKKPRRTGRCAPMLSRRSRFANPSSVLAPGGGAPETAGRGPVTVKLSNTERVEE